MGLGFPWIFELHLSETERLRINSSSGADSVDEVASGNPHAASECELCHFITA